MAMDEIEEKKLDLLIENKLAQMKKENLPCGHNRSEFKNGVCCKCTIDLKLKVSGVVTTSNDITDVIAPKTNTPRLRQYFRALDEMNGSNK